jgi:hypothetical protein
MAMRFPIELDIGLSLLLLQAALPQLVTDRETKTHRRERSARSYGHCRRRTEIPEAEPSPAARSRVILGVREQGSGGAQDEEGGWAASGRPRRRRDHGDQAQRRSAHHATVKRLGLG